VAITNITLIGPNPDETQGGGVRTRTLLDALNSMPVKVNRVYYSFHKKRLKINRTVNSDLSLQVEIDIPHFWPNPIKAFSLFFLLVYTWGFTKSTDAVLCTFGSMLFAIPPIFVSKLRGKPIMLDYIDTELYGVPEKVCAYFLRKAEIVFAISHYLVDQAVRYGVKDVVYLPTFVDTDFFRLNEEARLIYRNELGAERTDIVVGYAGSLAPLEGLCFLLEAYKRLLRKYVNIKLVIVGKILLPTDCDIPRLADNLGIAANVYLKTPVPRDEYPKLLSAFDILCVPRIDCLMSAAANPIKVTEYMSMGVPVVCSSVGEMPLIITDGISGYLAKPSDVDDLEKTLERLIVDKERATEVGRNGRKEVLNKYSFNLITERIRRSLLMITNKSAT
jgi:glycosyltransferase involved in cell wall biosynthesis